jgi:hypothetical protein
MPSAWRCCRAAWYPKPATAFADVLARLRQHFWFELFATSTDALDMMKTIRRICNGLF